jgi:DNA repair protein RadC
MKRPTTYKIPLYRCLMVKDRNFMRIPVGVTTADGALQSYDQVRKALHFLTDDSPTEMMVLFFLNGQNRVVGGEIVAKGGQHGCALTARDILRSALVSGASAFVVGHNHPSGDPKPSREDITMTTSLLAAAEAIGLPFLDHVIVARGGRANSLFEMGLFQHADS